MHQILVYGDSLSWGIIPGTRKRFSFSARWPGVMEMELLRQGQSVRVIEDCLNGRRTAWEDPTLPGRNGSVGLEQRIEIHSPLSLVMILLGTNDFQSVHQLDASDSAVGIRSLVTSIRRAPIEPGMRVPEIQLIAPPRIQSPKGEIAKKFKGAEAKAERIGSAIQQVADQTSCYFFDCENVTTTSKIDGVHLDQIQHTTLGCTLATEVRSILSSRGTD